RLATDVPDWVGSIGNVFDSLDAGSTGGDADWLAGVSPGAPAASPPARKGGSGLLRGRGLDNAPPPDPNASGASPVPDGSGGAATPASSSNQDEVPDWFKDPVPSTLSTPGAPDDSQQLPSGFTDLLAGVPNSPPQAARSAQPLSS